MATSKNTKDADARLKQQLESADIEKFKQVLQKAFNKPATPAKKAIKKN